ncbi:Rad51 domain-containing protein [Mycena indigotica]|uniref:Rad51 domain-containing protein n=1 Tax=Mycena indigotica TaxID=2126181 RepID=A0A8H6TF46_9AGAR|nr:Rad51 domain-containing protein [Mycena indigotica]KAF7316114.1 Rad51 domain-containing protein [Mycena indigotica]
MMERSLTSLSIPPSTLGALIKAGYETTADLDESTPEKLAKDLAIPLNASQAIFTQRTASRAPGLTLTQPASKTRASDERILIACEPLDKLLDGGLPRGSILELSGPPGTPKGAIAMGMVKHFVSSPDTEREEVVFLDTQSMTTPVALRKAIPDDSARSRVFHCVVQTVTDFIGFVHSLHTMKREKPKLGLIILSYMSFPLQASLSRKLTNQQRNAIFDNLKKALATLTSSGVTVLVTSQLATKVLAADGSPANFNTGARAILAPPLGTTYLPVSNSYRVVMCPQGLQNGIFRVITAPSKKDNNREQPYLIPPRRVLPILPPQENQQEA